MERHIPSILKKKTYNPKSLRQLSKTAVQIAYKHNWNCVKDIPRTLQMELLSEWLQCDETIPVSDEDLDKIEDVVSRGWKGMRPWGPQTFVYLMMLPDDTIPSFADHDNHVIWNYHTWFNGEKKLDLCNFCYMNISKEPKVYSANYWDEKDWTFWHVTDHTQVSGENILNTIWNRRAWCSVCYTEPLIDDILDYDECLADYSYHAKRRFRGYDSDSDSDSDFEYVQTSMMRMPGRRMDDNMYTLMKKNKWFEW